MSEQLQKDKNGTQICEFDIIKGKYHGLGETTIHSAVIRLEEVQWKDWDLDTVEVIGNLKKGIFEIKP